MKTCYLLLLIPVIFAGNANAQNCPVSSNAAIVTNPNTYYPGLNNTLAAGSKNITLGAAGSGSTPIATGDLLLLIQMQGAQINSTNTNSYGDGINGGGASGYLVNTNLIAGNMEYVVATNTVPLAGGSLSLLNGTVNAYKNASFGTDGQYRYQVIRVGLYYNLILAATIKAPNWNGTSGGVLVLSVTNSLNFNGQKLTAAGAGFRGGGARQLSGGNTGLSSDIVSLSTYNYHGSKGEGIAGTPRFVDNHGTILDNGGSNEGYPNGSYAAGAPGNAGGGGSDGNPGSNDQNSGGGGGANGGSGGRGGNSWNSNLPTGGEPGAVFAQKSPSRLVMGGGGGAGTTNNGTGSGSAGFSSSGAAGGGIIILTATAITGSGTIDVSGDNAFTTVLNDGSGGGGAGGSALVYAGSGLSAITVKAAGGTGGTNSGNGSPHGPGGGGGGGVVYSNSNLSASSTVAPGTAGFTSLGTTHFNAADGVAGLLLQNVSRSSVPNQFLYCTLLPVNFTSFTATRQQNDVLLQWQVSDETGAQFYSVERSEDGSQWTTIGTTIHQLSFTDTKNTGAAAVYYRIRETQAQGNNIYSSAIMVTPLEKTDALLSVQPNPATSSYARFYFNVNAPGSTTATIRVVSMNGITVWTKSVTAYSGMNVVTIDNLAAIPNGTYFIYNSSAQFTNTARLIVNH